MSFLKDAIAKKPPEAAPAASSMNLPDRYQGMLDANPYRNQKYAESPWQTFLSTLGFRTEADAWKENMAVQAAEYDAAIAQKAADEAYETPGAQVARMRAAGLNPDLNGGEGISPGEAESLPQDPSTPMQSTGIEGDISNMVSTFTNGILSCFSTALGLVGTFQGIRRNHLQNVLESFNIEGAVQGFAEKMAPTFLPPSPEDETLLGGFDWRMQTLKNAQAFSKKLPRSVRRKFLDYIENYWNSAPQERQAFDVFTGRVKSRKEFYGEYHENYSDIDKVLSSIWEPMAKNMERIVKLNQKALETGLNRQVAEDNEQMEFLKSHDATKQGEAANKSYDASIQQAEVARVLNETNQEIMNNLKSTSKKGGLEGFLANAFLSIMTMSAGNFLPSLPSFNLSNSPKTGFKLGIN